MATIGADIKVGGMQEFRKSMQLANQMTKQWTSQLQSIGSQFQATGNKEQYLTKSNNVLKKAMETAKSSMAKYDAEIVKSKGYMALLDRELKQAEANFGKNSKQAVKAKIAYDQNAIALSKLQTSYNKAEKEVNDLTIKQNENRSKTINSSFAFEKCNKTIDDMNKKLNKTMITTGNFIKNNIALKGISASFNKIKSSMSSAFERLDKITVFNSTMTTLLGSAKEAKNLFQQVDEAVTGTTFSLDQGANAVQNFITSGMSANKALAQFKMIEDAVSFFGAGTAEQLDTVSDAFVKMSAKGQVSAQQLNRLSDVGIPAVKILAEATGQSQAKIKESLKLGAMSASDFSSKLQSAMKNGTKSFKGIDGAAKRLGTKTFSGMFTNINTAITRGLANTITTIDNSLKKSGTSIEKILGNVKNKIDDAFKTIGVVLGNTITIFSKLGNALKPIAPIIKGVGLSILLLIGIEKGYKLITLAVSKATAILKSVQLAFTASTEAATVAQTGLNAVMAANPLGLVALGIGAVVSSLLIYNSTTDTASSKTETYKSKLTDEIKALNDEATAISENRKTRADSFDDIMANQSVTESLTSKVEALNEKEKLNAEQKGLLRTYIGELNSIYPELNLKIDEETGKTQDSTNAIKEKIKQLGFLAKKQALYDLIVQTTKENLQVEQKLMKSSEDYNTALGKKNKLINDIKTAEKKVADSYSMNSRISTTKAEEELKKLKDKKKAIDKNVKTAEEATLKFAKTYDNNLKDIKHWTKETKKSFKKGGAETTDTYVSGLISKIASGKIKVYNAYKKLTEAGHKGAKKGLDSKSPSKKAIKLGKDYVTGLTIGVESLKDKLSETSKKITKLLLGNPAEYKIGLKKSISEMSKSMTTSMSSFLKDMKKSKLSKSDATAKVKDFISGTKESTNKLLDAIKQQTEKAKEAYNTAKQEMQDYAKSVADGFSGLIEKSLTSVNSAGGYLKSLQKSLQTAKEFRNNLTQLANMGISKTIIDKITSMGAEEGNAVAKSLLKGADANIIAQINSTIGSIEAEGNALGSKLSKQYYQVGVDTANGIYLGLKSQQKKIQNLLKEMADSMTKTIKKKLKIKSPSRVFMNIGEMVTAGLSEGLVGSVNDVYKAIGKVNNAVMDGISSPFTVPIQTTTTATIGKSLDNALKTGINANIDNNLFMAMSDKMGEIVSNKLNGAKIVMNSRELGREIGELKLA